jgi:hypothetical protein
MSEGLSESQRFGPAFVDRLFGDIPYEDPDGPDSRALGIRIRQMEAVNPKDGEEWSCADITHVIEDQGELITKRHFVVGRGTPKTEQWKQFTFDVDEGGMVAPADKSPEQLIEMHEECNIGIAVLRKHGR